MKTVVFKPISSVFEMKTVVFKPISVVFEMKTVVFKPISVVFEMKTVVFKPISVVFEMKTVVFKPISVVFEMKTVVFKMKTVVFEMKTVVFEMKTVVFKMKTVVFEMKTVVFEMKTVVFEMISSVFEMKTVVFEMKTVVFKMISSVFEMKTVVFEMKTLVLCVRWRRGGAPWEGGGSFFFSHLAGDILLSHYFSLLLTATNIKHFIMRIVSLLLAGLCNLLLLSCVPTGSGVLFDGQDVSRWDMSGNVSVADGLFTLSGSDARAILKGGKYRNFSLTMEVRTGEEGKGAVWFHTNPDLSKGYCVLINNDRADPVWWKMSGSLLGVRNLTKSTVKEDEWFTLEIIVEGKSIEVCINGNPVVEYIEPSAPFRIPPYEEALLSEGMLAIASEGPGKIEFSRITLASLDGVESADVAAQLTEAIDEQTDRIIRLHQEDFPVLDCHVHLKGGLTIEEAAAQSRRTGINYAIAPNCGVGFPITDDVGAMNFLNEMRREPFILGMQCEGREWVETFSEEVRNEFDFVFTDALTFTDDKGRRSRIWIPEETWIENEQEYMDLIVDRICSVLQEPIDIYVNPCFLPQQMQDRFDEFWTEERMNRFVSALAESGKALEINARYRIPNKAIIKKAKEAGVKFTFGTNNELAAVGKLEYCTLMKEECGLTIEDMYVPYIRLE